MAKRGDGTERSDNRRLSELIYLRTDAAEKERFKRAAERENFPTFSAWAMDRLRSDRGMSLRERRILSAQLGQLTTPLRNMVRGDGPASPQSLKDLLQAIDAKIIATQKTIMKGDADAGEGDIEQPE